MKTIKSYRFEEEIINKIKEIAEKEHRTLTNQIEYILKCYIENQTPTPPKSLGGTKES